MTSSGKGRGGKSVQVAVEVHTDRGKKEREVGGEGLRRAKEGSWVSSCAIGEERTTTVREVQEVRGFREVKKLTGDRSYKGGFPSVNWHRAGEVQG